MSTPALPSPEQRKPINLAKLATIFAVVFGVAFGLCSVTALSVGGNINQYVIGTALVIEATCAVGLIVIAILAIVRSVRS
jgi:hypothetical protein